MKIIFLMGVHLLGTLFKKITLFFPIDMGRLISSQNSCWN